MWRLGESLEQAWLDSYFKLNESFYFYLYSLNQLVKNLFSTVFWFNLLVYFKSKPVSHLVFQAL
jgi:hypothetical protein